MTISIVYSLFGSEEEATIVLQDLLSFKMVACGNCFPCNSHFVWSQNIKNEKEWVLIVKTSQQLVSKVCEWLEKHHPYDIPAILSWTAEANERYARWVENQVMIDAP